SRCQISSMADFTQFIGSSPQQVYYFEEATRHSVIYAAYAAQDAFDGDWESFAIDSGLSAYYAAEAFIWFMSTKVELEGPTYMFGNLSHGDLHEPPVWNSIWRKCAVN